MSEHLSPDDRRWLELRDCHALDEFLTPEQRRFLRDYEPHDPALATEKALFAEFDALVDGPVEAAVSSTDDRRQLAQEHAATDALVASTLQRFALAQRPAAVVELSMWRRPRVWIVGTVVAVAASVVLWIRVGGMEPGSASTPPTLAESSSPSLAPTTTVTTEPIFVASGVLVAGDKSFHEGDALDRSVSELIASSGSACLARGGTQVCLDAASRVAVRGQTVDVLAGEVTVDVHLDTRSMDMHQGSLQLSVAGMRVVSPTTTRYRVEVFERDGGWQVAVPEGQAPVQVESAAGQSVTNVPPGFAFARGSSSSVAVATGRNSSENRVGADGERDDTEVADSDSVRPRRGPTAPPRSARDLARALERARSLRAAGEYRQAARAYEQLTVSHRHDALARAALVSLGQLYAGPLKDPRKALSAYERYLAGGNGALAEEARYGRIEALQKLGRKQAERKAIEEFLEAHPASSYAPKLRQRLD